MNPLSKNLVKTMIILLSLILSSVSVFCQNFQLVTIFGAGQASSEFESDKLAITSGIGVGYETKSEIVNLSAIVKSESYNFYDEPDLTVFSLPLIFEIHPRFNPKPYLGVLIAPSYPTQSLITRYFFLTGGIQGGISYDFKPLTAFAQFEYLKDLTGYNRSDDILSASEVDKYYLNRYYITVGVRVGL